MATNGQSFVQVGNSKSLLPEPSAEHRIKKLIICSFADRIPSARTVVDSSIKADVYSFSVNSDHVDPSFWDVDPPAKQAIRVRA